MFKTELNKRLAHCLQSLEETYFMNTLCPQKAVGCTRLSYFSEKKVTYGLALFSYCSLKTFVPLHYQITSFWCFNFATSPHLSVTVWVPPYSSLPSLHHCPSTAFYSLSFVRVLCFLSLFHCFRTKTFTKHGKERIKNATYCIVKTDKFIRGNI